MDTWKLCGEQHSPYAPMGTHNGDTLSQLPYITISRSNDFVNEKRDVYKTVDAALRAAERRWGYAEGELRASELFGDYVVEPASHDSRAYTLPAYRD